MFTKITNVGKLFLTLLALSSITCYAQSGPGGISNGASNYFWFDVTDLNFYNGQFVQNWPNRGSSSEPLYQNTLSKSPVFRSSAAFTNNGFPSVKFDGSNDVLKLLDTDELNLVDSNTPDENRSYSFVVKTDSDVSTRQTIYDEGGKVRGFNVYINNDSLFVGAWNIRDSDGPDAPWGFYYTGVDISPNSLYIISFVFEGNSSKSGTIKCYLNNTLFGTINNVGRIYPHDTGAGLGNIKGKTTFEDPTGVVNGNRAFKGTISEWIFLDHAYSEAERIIVENYLGGKYDISLPTNYYTQRNFHQHEIIGIGQANDGSNHTQSKAKSILTISNPDSLDNGDFFFTGHDNGSLSTTKICPDVVSSRLERIWRVTELSDVGNISVSFDLSYMIEIPTDPTDFMLLKDTDGDFTDAMVLAYADTIIDSEVIFNNIDLNWSDFFTLGMWKTITWDGANYNNGTGTASAPGVNDTYRKFIVQAPGATVTEEGEVDCMIINLGSDLVINEGISLTVHNEINNEGVVDVKENAELIQTHTGIDNNSGSGTYKMARTGIKNSLAYNGWSSPMKDANILATFASTNPCDIFAFDSDRQNWYYDYPVGTTVNCNGNLYTFVPGNLIPGADGIFDPGYGYFSVGSPNADSTKVFSGTANNGIVSVKTYQEVNPTNVNWTGDDWNLVGNPYLSAIDAFKFWEENAVNNPKIIEAIHYWDDDYSAGSGYDENDDYASWNLLGGTAASSGRIPNGYISSGQAFWVVANLNNNVIFNNSMRGGDNSQFFKGERNPLNASRLWLSIETPKTRFNQILVGFSDSATTGYDRMIDAHKVEGNPNIVFGSKVNGENDPFIIQGLPFIEFNESVTVPLYVKTKDEGIHHFNLDKISHFGTDYSFFIKDNETNKLHNIQNGPLAAYMDTGVFANRFELIVVNNQSTADGNGSSGDLISSIDDIEDNENVFVHQTGSELVVKYDLNNELETISVTNINGVEMLKNTATEKSGQSTLSIGNLASGVYFVTLTGSDYRRVEKVVIQ